MNEWIANITAFAECRLTEPQTLERLAQVAELSPTRFHRGFQAATGETPTKFVNRLRVEKAAHRLMLHSDSVLDIALDCGFANHETLIRSFRRRFHMTPTQYRDAGTRELHSGFVRRKPQPTEGFEVSPIRFSTLRPLRIAALRHVGPYEEVDPDLWLRLEEWSKDRWPESSYALPVCPASRNGHYNDPQTCAD